MLSDNTRAHGVRDGLRLPSNLTDREWALIAPHLICRSFPPATTAQHYFYG